MPAKKIFVEMEYHKNCIKLDDGTNKKPQKVKDENGKDLKFISLIAAINYMSLQGWELVGTAPGGGSTSGVAIGNYMYASSDSKVYYLFSKEVSDEELQEAVNNGYKK